jgi:hypothetical protein
MESMSIRSLRGARRAGVLLDLVLATGIVLVGAFVLYSFGLTLGELVHGAGQFFGY